MWTSGALSVFNDAVPNGIGETEQQFAPCPLRGKRSPGVSGFLGPPGEDVSMGLDIDDAEMAAIPDARRDPATVPLFREEYDFSNLLDQNPATSFFDNMPGFSSSIDDTVDLHRSQDFDLGASTHLTFAGTPLSFGNQNLLDASQLPPSDLIDFNAQPLPFDDAAFLPQTRLGPTAPLSPAPTPPPSFPSEQDKDLPAPLQTNNQRWQATLTRSRQADKHFLYGVTTTKVFCRPSCPSRRAARAHVVFFSFPGAIEAAQSASFRPCKRCKPEALDTTDSGVLGVIRVLRLIVADASSPFDPTGKDLRLESLAEEGGLSAFHFHRLFKATTQLTPGDFLAASRSLALGDALAKDTRALQHNPHTSNDAPALITASAKWKPRTARKALGSVSPVDYANGAQSHSIQRVSIDDTPYGAISIAYSSHGDILAVLAGYDSKDRIKIRFPGVVDSETHAGNLKRCIWELYDAGRDREGDIPEDIKRLLWRARVWIKLVRDNVLEKVDL